MSASQVQVSIFLPHYADDVLCKFLIRGGHNGGAGGAQATPGILIFQKQVTLFTKSGDTLDLE